MVIHGYRWQSRREWRSVSHLRYCQMPSSLTACSSSEISQTTNCGRMQKSFPWFTHSLLPPLTLGMTSPLFWGQYVIFLGCSFLDRGNAYAASHCPRSIALEGDSSHAIANQLARDALRNIPVEALRTTFETPGRNRLLMSFAHRLGLLHDHSIAKEIVRAKLQEGELLGNLSSLDDNGARILEYVALVPPNTVLDRIEAEIGSADFVGMEVGHNPRRTTILSLLVSLAYEPEAFERCITMLLRVADFVEESNNYDCVRNKFVRFFQAYLWGTHATLEQRLTVVRGVLLSGTPKRRSLGFRMLSAALDGPPWTGAGSNDFGARPRDFGYQPDHDKLVDWRSQFMDLALEMDQRNDPELSGPVRRASAQEFRGLWHHAAMRGKLVRAARQLNSSRSWVEGWSAVRTAIHFDYRKTKADGDVPTIPEDLAALEQDLAPTELMANIGTFVLGRGADHWALDDDFGDNDGKKYAASEERLAAKARVLGVTFACSGKKSEILAINSTRQIGCHIVVRSDKVWPKDGWIIWPYGTNSFKNCIGSAPRISTMRFFVGSSNK